MPYIVRQCVEEVEKRGIEEVGIYRISGVATDIQALKAVFDASECGRPRLGIGREREGALIGPVGFSGSPGAPEAFSTDRPQVADSSSRALFCDPQSSAACGGPVLGVRCKDFARVCSCNPPPLQSLIHGSQ